MWAALHSMIGNYAWLILSLPSTFSFTYMCPETVVLVPSVHFLSHFRNRSLFGSFFNEPLGITRRLGQVAGRIKKSADYTSPYMVDAVKEMTVTLVLFFLSYCLKFYRLIPLMLSKFLLRRRNIIMQIRAHVYINPRGGWGTLTEP